MNLGLTKKVLQSTISEGEAEKQVCGNYTMWQALSFVGTYFLLIIILNGYSIFIHIQWSWNNVIPFVLTDKIVKLVYQD